MTARHVENVVVELHVDPADTAAGHVGHIPIFKRPHDGAAGHQEGIPAVALGKRLDLPAAHHKVINAIALIDDAGDQPAMHRDAVSPRPEGHRAIDAARAVDGQYQRVVTRQIDQRRRRATVTDEAVVTGRGAERAGGMGVMHSKAEQREGEKLAF